MSVIEHNLREMFREEAAKIIHEIVEPAVEMFPDLPPIATVPELAAALRVSDDVLRQTATTGGLPHSHVGRELRFNKAMIIEWTATGRKYACEICAEKDVKPLPNEGVPQSNLRSLSDKTSKKLAHLSSGS